MNTFLPAAVFVHLAVISIVEKYRADAVFCRTAADTYIFLYFSKQVNLSNERSSLKIVLHCKTQRLPLYFH